MRRALDDLASLDLVLIDTAGRSPRDELQIQELKRLLVEARVDEVHLVLSLSASLRSLRASAEKFASANATSLILTKLDEAAGLGSLLALADEVNLPISYLTTGQDVPNDIEPARADRIARLILGLDEMPR
jgi:flagellar biosynthesis protein FlhF